MARDILSEYGPETHKPQHTPARSGGVTMARDVMGYAPPQGPSNINDPKGPGLHGHNHGQCGTQGPNPTTRHESGRPGLGGVSHGHGTNRK